MIGRARHRSVVAFGIAALSVLALYQPTATWATLDAETPELVLFHLREALSQPQIARDVAGQSIAC